MSGQSGVAWAGVARCRSDRPSTATNRPWPSGNAPRGPRSKNARRLGAHLAFLDASGLLLMPTRRRTWAPAGPTPMIPYHDKPDRLSALATLTGSPERQPLGLYLRFQPRHFQALEVPADAASARHPSPRGGH